MNRILILLCLMLFFFSCEKEEKKTARPKRSMAHLLPYEKAKKIVGSYTGRHDTTMYLHRWVMDFEGDRVDENVIVSEMLSDPQPLVSVFFKKKDTLIFIPVSAVSGTIPEVKELFFEKGRKAELGVWYTSRETDGSYTYNFSAYTFYDREPYCMFNFQLYKISPDGNIVKPRVIEIDKNKDGNTEVRLFEAEVKNLRTEVYFNKGPLLVKKSKEPIAVYLYKKYSSKEAAIWGSHLFPISGENTIGYRCAMIPTGKNY